MLRRIAFCMTAMAISLPAFSTDLVTVYESALRSDPVFLRAVYDRLATKEGVPIGVAALLPTITASINPTLTRYGYAGTNYDPAIDQPGSPYILPRNITTRTYNLNLVATQTVFNFQQFSQVAQNIALSRGADATLNASLQDLMTRVAKAYFAILSDEEKISYREASQRAYKEQLDQVQEQFKVGLKTQTDVYTAKASYDISTANLIAANTALAVDKENLRVITGIYYHDLAALRNDFPLITPKPEQPEIWVNRAIRQNWSIKAQQYNVESARQVIHEQYAGHLPTVNVQAGISRQYLGNLNGYTTFSDRNGPGTTTEKSFAINVNMPLFAGGGVVAATKQAGFQFCSQQEQLEKVTRDVVNYTRQSYLNIVQGIAQISADREAIKSARSSLEGLEASYNVGTETLVDVLDERQKLLEAQVNYANDRYNFVNNILALKEAAGTLSFGDLLALNRWLTK